MMKSASLSDDAVTPNPSGPCGDGGLIQYAVRGEVSIETPCRRTITLSRGGRAERQEILPNQDRGRRPLVCSLSPLQPAVVLRWRRRREEVFPSGEARPLAAD